MISEKRLAANRENAQKSTGPRTEEGKTNSRRNSLKQGYTGDGVVLTAEDALAYDDRREQFLDCVRPRNHIEAELVNRMALASVRMERCRKAENARIEKRQVNLENRYNRKAQSRLQAALEVFANDCKGGHELLVEFTFGCQHLKRQWEQLGQALDDLGAWDDDRARHAERLLGADPAAANLEDSTVWLVRVFNTLAKRDTSAAPVSEALQALGHLSSEAFQQLLAETFGTQEPSPAEALAQLRGFVAEHVAALQQRAMDLWTKERRPYALDCSIALVDSSPEAMRQARYESMNELSFHRAWNTLRKIRQDDPPPIRHHEVAEAQNEPNEETATQDSTDICASSDDPAQPAVGAVSNPPEPALDPATEATFLFNTALADLKAYRQASQGG